jgi:hypothetical protein
LPANRTFGTIFHGIRSHSERCYVQYYQRTYLPRIKFGGYGGMYDSWSLGLGGICTN